MPLNSDSNSASVGVNGWVYGAGFFALLAALAPFGVNLAVGLSPVFPGNVFMDADARAATVALFVLGLGLGQPLMGGAADHWGRRPAMMAGLLLGLLGAIAAAFSNSDTQLLWARFISGFGFSACMVIPRVCLRDLHQGALLQRNMATLSNVFAVTPVITQPLAWALGHWFHWRVPLLALVVLVVVVIFVSWRWQPETRSAGTLAPKWGVWMEVAKDALILRTCFTFACANAPFFVVAAIGPAAIKQSTGVSGGVIAAILGITYLGFAVGNYWVRRNASWPSNRLINQGLCSIGVSMLLFACTLWWPSLWLWSLALSAYAVGQGIVFPAGFSLVLEGRALQAGVASAIIGTIHMTTGGLVAWLAGSLPWPQDISLVWVCSAVSGLAVFIWMWMKPVPLTRTTVSKP
jgi:DHA1 family bicyclomycin/chloramphenicol resistance-like MFS transporter